MTYNCFKSVFAECDLLSRFHIVDSRYQESAQLKVILTVPKLADCTTAEISASNECHLRQFLAHNAITVGDLC
jgi:hypothetical protein